MCGLGHLGRLSIFFEPCFLTYQMMIKKQTTMKKNKKIYAFMIVGLNDERQ
jgi:hypothetical protein